MSCLRFFSGGHGVATVWVSRDVLPCRHQLYADPQNRLASTSSNPDVVLLLGHPARMDGRISSNPWTGDTCDTRGMLK